MKDRVPTKPNRKAVYDDSHNFLRYEYHERADEPSEAGTPLSKAALLTDATAARLGLGSSATPNEAFAVMPRTFGPLTLTASTAWSGSGPWTQSISASGVTAADNLLELAPVDMADAASRKLYEAAYGCLAATFATYAGSITLTCREKRPTTAFQFILKGVR